MTSSSNGGDGEQKAVDQETVDKNSEYYKKNVLPVDRGWAWVICFGGFLTYFVFGFSSQTVAVLFVEIIDKFETTITTASLIFMFGVLSVSFMSIIATNVLMPRFGEKKVVCVASILFVTGSIGYSLSPNIIVFLVFAAIKGIAGGSVFVPSISLIRHYFHKRRSIAQIIANTGQSVAFIIAPSIIRAVRKEYGISGTFLLLAGMELHIMVSGLLLRPLEAYKFRPELPPMPRRGKKKGAADQKQNGEATTNPNGPEAQEDLEVTQETSISHADEENRVQTGNDHLEDKGVTEKLLGGHKEPTGPVDNAEVAETSGQNGAGIDGPDEKSKEDRHYASALSLVSEAAVDQLVEEEVSREDNKKVKERLCQRFGPKFFSLWAFRIILILTPFAASNVYMRTYIPTVTKTQGATLDESALLFTIVGAVELISRLSLGFVADTHILKPSQMIAISEVSLGILYQFVRFFTTFETMIVMSVILGLFIGARPSLLPLLAMEVVGVEMMPQAFSIIATVSTLSVASMNPIFGAIAEATGNFVTVMHIAGVFLFISSSLLSLLPLLKRVDKKRAQDNDGHALSKTP